VEFYLECLRFGCHARRVDVVRLLDSAQTLTTHGHRKPSERERRKAEVVLECDVGLPIDCWTVCDDGSGGIFRVCVAEPTQVL
jgi:hypothetical protein